MVTNQQAIANKNNTAKGTGPKTGGGKAKVNGNALKQGLQAPTRLLLHPRTLTALRDELRASRALQHNLFNLILSKFWRLMRIVRIETDILESEVSEDR